jgi:hypothetical protein
MKCPLLNAAPCYRTNCAWWDPIEGCCVIHTISESLSTVAFEVKEDARHG